MAFAFCDPYKPTAKAVRNLARKRMANSQTLLETRVLPPNDLVRELRKNIKKTRALLRLVRPHFKTFSRENDTLREAAQLIAPLRDADALAATFDRVALRAVLSPDTLFALRNNIVTPPNAMTQSDTNALLAAHGSAVAEVAVRASGWKITGNGFDAFADGLEKTWTDAQKAMDRAIAVPTGENLHNWRKRVKDHWYHSRLLSPIWPEMMLHHVAAANTLGETLGEARDLAFLIAALGEKPEAKKVRDLAAEEEARLLADALSLGSRFFAEPASGLSRRWRGWWKIWHGQPKPDSDRQATSRSAQPSPEPHKEQ